jgi:hypothetical protein
LLEHKPTNAHTLLELQCFNMSTPTCFEPHWPIIKECSASEAQNM